MPTPPTLNSLLKSVCLNSVVKKADSAIHRINRYPVDSAIGFPTTNLLDRNLSDG